MGASWCLSCVRVSTAVCCLRIPLRRAGGHLRGVLEPGRGQSRRMLRQPHRLRGRHASLRTARAVPPVCLSFFVLPICLSSSCILTAVEANIRLFSRMSVCSIEGAYGCGKFLFGEERGADLDRTVDALLFRRDTLQCLDLTSINWRVRTSEADERLYCLLN